MQIYNILWLKFLNGSVKKTFFTLPKSPLFSARCSSPCCFKCYWALLTQPSLPWSDEQTIDTCRFPIRPLQIRWRVSHLAFTIVINEYLKIYKHITCCCERTQSMHPQWRMANVSRSIETVDNEESRYISMEHTKLEPRNWLTSTLLGKSKNICKD